MKKINSHWYNLSSNCTLNYFKCFLKIDSFKTHKNPLRCTLQLHFTDEKKWSLESLEIFPRSHTYMTWPKVRVFTACCSVQFCGVWWVGWEISRWEWLCRCLRKWEWEKKGDNGKRNKALTTFYERAVCALYPTHFTYLYPALRRHRFLSVLFN